MLQWRVIVLASLAVLLILAGLMALTVPDAYEGAVLYTVDEQHAVSKLDGIGLAILALGCLVAWAAAVTWRRWMRAT